MAREEQNGELARLLHEMRPFLHELPVVFCMVRPGVLMYLPFEPLGLFHEEEGVTVIAPVDEADRAELPYDGWWAHITLGVQSPLDTVGFMAAVTSALARAGISVNPVSAFHHDHLFVPWKRREEAMEIMKNLESS